MVRHPHCNQFAVVLGRAAIERQSARILAAHASPQIIDALRNTVSTEENISSPSVDAYFRANRAIHRKMVELSDNRYLIEMFDNIWNRAVSYNLFATIANVDLAQSFGDHMRLVDAIESGNPSIALEAVVDHITHGFDLQIKGLETRS
ncbi:MAG: GntR family transcriptional regulator [Nitratireductor sp.]|nr:GntR family transcriptional regulator [Nitratireductor sp.]